MSPYLVNDVRGGSVIFKCYRIHKLYGCRTDLLTESSNTENNMTLSKLKNQTGQCPFIVYHQNDIDHIFNDR